MVLHSRASSNVPQNNYIRSPSSSSLLSIIFPSIFKFQNQNPKKRFNKNPNWKPNLVVVVVVVALHGDDGSGREVRQERSKPNQRPWKTKIIKTRAIGTRSCEVKWQRENIARKIQTLCEKFLKCYAFSSSGSRPILFIFTF